MSETDWTPSEDELRSGQESYIRYIGGLMLLHDPDSLMSQALMGTLPPGPESTLAVVEHAEALMYHGLKEMIVVANPPEYHPVSRAENRHAQALPVLRDIVDATCDQHTERLEAINFAITVARPMPLARQGLYKAICHGRRDKISTSSLMDVFIPNTWFKPVIAGRHIHARATG
jgi:hypothetical protein